MQPDGADLRLRGMRTGQFVSGAVVATALAAFAVAGCGADQSTGTAQQPTSSASSPAPPTLPSTPSPQISAPGKPDPSVGLPPSSVPPPSDATLVPDSQVDSSGLPPFYEERTVWVLGDGRTLQMYAMATNGCANAQGRITEQTAGDVRVTLESLTSPQGGKDVCAQSLQPKRITVTLNEPLGSRTVHLVAGT